MLVISRNRNQRIIIGDSIILTVVRIHGRRGRVALGIEAPKEIPVHREEIAREIAAGKTRTPSRNGRTKVEKANE